MSLVLSLANYFRRCYQAPISAPSNKTTAILLPILLGISLPLVAAILPEDRADVLYHSYDGGGIQIKGPSILIRKSIGEYTSLSYNYYVDSITSASVDVLTFGSPYTEKRVENDISVEYLADNTTLSIGAAHSTENDYTAQTGFLGISHSAFGDLTTVSVGFSVGADDVGSRGSELTNPIKRYAYKLDISQILTKSIILNLGIEAITEEGALNNPYRQIITVDTSGLQPVRGIAAESYPQTRTSNAIALRAMYYMPYRAKLYGEVRGFNDSWDITAGMWQVGYTHPFGKRLIIDAHYRVYSQTKASFFADIVNVEDLQIFAGRDKELDALTSVATGFSLTYKFLNSPWWIFDRGTLNISLDRMVVDYDSYTDRSVDPADKYSCGSCEPYQLQAEVLQIFWSVWY